MHLFAIWNHESNQTIEKCQFLAWKKGEILRLCLMHEEEEGDKKSRHKIIQKRGEGNLQKRKERRFHVAFSLK